MKAQRALDPYDWQHLRDLLARAFAGMDGRIDPPSSLHHLMAGDIAAQAVTGEVWVIGAPAVACVFLKARSVPTLHKDFWPRRYPYATTLSRSVPTLGESNGLTTK